VRIPPARAKHRFGPVQKQNIEKARERAANEIACFDQPGIHAGPKLEEKAQ
jgi:hypothetical protein